MNGAESLVRTLLASGVNTCFANPGTSEMHFVAALDQVSGVRCVLGLFEGVVTGAADGYARMADKPAATLLHCGPGLANGLANLHNARRAQVPIVNLIGDQATYHRPLDAPLTAETEAWVRPVSIWTRTATRAESVGADVAAAVQAARSAPGGGGIASLILPSDVCWNAGGVVAEPLPVLASSEVDRYALEATIRVLRSGEPALILLGGTALRAEPLADAYRIAAATGARLLATAQNTRIERGRGRHPIGRVPYSLDDALEQLAGIKHLILVGATEPVAFFAYPGKPGMLCPADVAVHVLAGPEHNLANVLACLADELHVSSIPLAENGQLQEPAYGTVTPEAVAQTLTALMPEEAIVIDESISLGRVFYPKTRDAAPHDWLQLTGGAIGDGLPMAVGAAIAAPGRRVVTLQADGSAMYTVQALWTQARERLDITTIILSNRAYAILFHELANVGARPGRAASDLFSLTNPNLDWVRIAAGMGVEAAQAESMERFAELFVYANNRPGPFLIELVFE